MTLQAPNSKLLPNTTTIQQLGGNFQWSSSLSRSRPDRAPPLSLRVLVCGTRHLCWLLIRLTCVLVVYALRFVLPCCQCCLLRSVFAWGCNMFVGCLFWILVGLVYPCSSMGSPMPLAWMYMVEHRQIDCGHWGSDPQPFGLRSFTHNNYTIEPLNEKEGSKNILSSSSY